MSNAYELSSLKVGDYFRHAGRSKLYKIVMFSPAGVSYTDREKNRYIATNKTKLVIKVNL